VPSRPMWLDQMHGADVAIFRNNARAKNPRAADAAVTCERDVVLSVLIADCLPVLFAERNGRVVGIAHAGWRGLARGVLETTVAAMDVAAEDIVAWLGPAIGMHAFEVGDDVIDAFADSNIAACFRLKRVGKWNADLYAIARARLARCGVHDVHGGGYCTFTDRARFFSYRRDGQTGRMAALIWIAS